MPAAITSSSSTIRTFGIAPTLLRVSRDPYEELRVSFTAAVSHELRTPLARLLVLPLRARMLRIVVHNLLVNALRHAGEGATCVVTLRREDGGRLLSVSDNGPGVAPEDLPRLFERFYRADRARATRGTGLGLAIVKHVITSGGGTVEAARGAEGGLEIRAAFPA